MKLDCCFSGSTVRDQPQLSWFSACCNKCILLPPGLDTNKLENTYHQAPIINAEIETDAFYKSKTPIVFFVKRPLLTKNLSR